MGLGHLLTEDVVRFAAARALSAAGCQPSELRTEWPHPLIKGSRVDLVVGKAPEVAIEFKYPREPNEKNAAWTMALGEVLKDLYRLSVLPVGERLFVYVETERLGQYMAGAAARYGLNLDVDEVVLDPRAAGLLPRTAAEIIGPDLLARRVTARRLHRLSVGEGLRLSVYLVHAVATPVDAAVFETSANQPGPALQSPVGGVPRPSGGAREEIRSAVRAVLQRSGKAVFSVDDLLHEMRGRGSRYAESTVRTMLTSHLCVNAPNHAAVTYGDYERVGRGLYRVA